MRINQFVSPCFEAKLIKSDINIARYNAKLPVSFVRIEPNNPNDVKAIKDVSDNWIHGKFCKNIFYAVESLRDKDKCYANHEVYALTSQNSKYNNLDGDKILGLIDICKYNDTDAFIEYIEAHPKSVYSSSPEYKGIGTAILNSIKEFCSKISCFPSKSKYVKDFYNKNGFIEFPFDSNHFIWMKR